MIDLHTHSTFSDGTDDPEAIVRLADAAGLTAVALTDHDTLDGLPRFLDLQAETTVRLVAGIELSCRFLGMELHVLGLMVQPSDAVFQTRVQMLQQRRDARNAAMLEALKQHRITLEWDAVRQEASRNLVSRSHFAKALVRHGHARDPQDAFRRWIGDGAPAYVPFDDLSPQEACTWIREAGGIPVVAHPGRSARRAFPWEDALQDLKRQGMGGIEAYYSEYSPTETRYFTALAAALGMACSGGSDYHGTFKPGIRLGVGYGSLSVPDGLLDALDAQRGAL